MNFGDQKLEQKIAEISFFEGLTVKILNTTIKYKLKIHYFSILSRIFKEITCNLWWPEDFPYHEFKYRIINDQKELPQKRSCGKNMLL